MYKKQWTSTIFVGMKVYYVQEAVDFNNLCLLQNYIGLFFVLPCTDDVRVVDLRTITFDVQPQEVGEPYI